MSYDKTDHIFGLSASKNYTLDTNFSQFGQLCIPTKIWSDSTKFGKNGQEAARKLCSVSRI